MSQDVRQTELHERTQSLLQGPLKHARAAALAAALIPLASVTPAQAQANGCPGSGGVCGTVWNDTNGNGIQEAGEPGIEYAKVTLLDDSGINLGTVDTGPDGFYYFDVPGGTYTIEVKIEPGWEPSPADDTNNAFDTFDSDGVEDQLGNSSFHGDIPGGDANTDFGFIIDDRPEVGTGTPGYWKNHPEAWPIQSITVGGRTYTKAQAIAWLGKVGKDKTTSMFSSLVSAMLNVANGTDASCATAAIGEANSWMAAHPVGSNVSGSSPAWADGEAWHQYLDDYNNGLKCAPHRN